MSETDRDPFYMGHMLDHARRAVAKTAKITREEFDADENLRITLTHLIQIIGEAARKASKSARSAHPEIPWRRIMGMRHRIVHDYMNVSDDALWRVVTIHLPPLIAQLSAIVPDPVTPPEPPESNT